MATEFELKFRADSDTLAAIEAAFPGAYRSIPMRTTYYDTPAGELSALRWTLRRRLEGDRSVCTLKVPGTNGARGEYEVERDNIHAAIDELCKLSNCPQLAQLAANGLVEVCGAAFTRRCVDLVLPDCTVELALDQGVLQGGDRELPLCECEAELKTGSQAAAVAFGQELARRFDLVPEAKSKFRRALDLAKGD